MSAEQHPVEQWFATLLPQDRVAWLEVRQTAAGLTPALLRTLPERRRPGHADAWVLGPVDPSWLASPTDGDAFVLAAGFGAFLAAEYDLWYASEG